nr:hypothetical protein [Tanacetum cinerariifolium]
MDICTTLTRRVKHLELDKIAQALEITKLKQRIKKLERRNKVKVLKLERVGTAQRIDTSDDTVMDDVSSQGRMIADMDADADVVLEEAKEVADDAKNGQDAGVQVNPDIQERTIESQVEIYKIDMDHANKVLCMQEEESKPAELQEVVDIITTAKIITKVVTAASTTITAADLPIPAATTAAASTLTAAPSKRTNGVVIRDPEESTTITSTIIHSKAKTKDKGKGILVEEPKLLKKYQALKRKPQTKAQARKNMMIYLKNVAGFKMDYFKGMYYDDIRPIFEAKFDSNMAFLQKTKEQIDEKESRALKRILYQRKHQKGKRWMRREDLEALWSFVKERFATTKPKNFSDDFLLITLGARFEKPDIHAQIWKNQRSVYGPAKVKSWKLLESCGMLNAVRLEVKDESEHLESLRESILERAKHKRENDRRVNDITMQSKEVKVASSKTLDVGLIVTECSGTKSDKQDTSSRSRNDTHTEDVDIKPVNDKEPMAEVQLTTQHNVLANEQQHSVQFEPIYDAHLIKKVDRNTTPDSTNMCHSGGEIDQNAKKFTPRYFSKVRVYVLAKPHHVIAPGSSRNSSKESYGSNDMAHNYYLEETKKKTQDKNRNLKPREMPSARTHHTLNAGTQKPKSKNQTSRNWPTSKSNDWGRLFQPMFDEYFIPPSIAISLVQEAAAPRAVVLAESLVSTSIDQDAPLTSIPSTQEHSLNISQGFEESPKTPSFCDDPLHESLHEDSTSLGSSSNVRKTYTLFEHLEPKNFKQAMTEPNAKLEQETELLKTTLRNKEATIASLTSETKTVLSEKKALEDKYLEEIVCLKNVNQVANGLGLSNLWFGRKAQLSQPTLYDGHRLLQPSHAPVTVYWLSASDIASQSSDLPKPVTPFIHTCSVNSEVHTKVWKIKKCLTSFEEVIKKHIAPPSDVLYHREYNYIKKCFDEEVIPFFNNIKQLFQLLDHNIYMEVKEFERIFDEFDSDSKDICSIVLASVNIVPPISDCMCAELRTSCDREHNRVLEPEAKISKLHNMLKESEKCCAFIQKDHIDLQVKFQNFKECANSNATLSNAIFEINKLKDQLQERDETIRNLESQFNISRMLKIRSPVGSLDKNAIETEITKLKDNITSLRIQNDGYKIEIENHTRRYLELSKASTHSRNTSNEKIA